jgi:hypothetical protein
MNHCGLSYCGYPDHECQCLCCNCILLKDDEEAAQEAKDEIRKESQGETI